MAKIDRVMWVCSHKTKDFQTDNIVHVFFCDEDLCHRLLKRPENDHWFCTVEQAANSAVRDNNWLPNKIAALRASSSKEDDRGP